MMGGWKLSCIFKMEEGATNYEMPVASRNRKRQKASTLELSEEQVG